MKDITVTSSKTKVIKRDRLSKEIRHDMRTSKDCLSIEEVKQLYEELHQYTWADDTIKEAHVDHLRKRWGTSST